MVKRVKAAKKYALKPPKVTPARLNRKCRACGRWGTVKATETCPWCGKEYGRLVLGDDLPKDVAPAVDDKGFPVREAPL